MDEQKKKSWVTESLLIAAAPFLGYLLAFSFELGYATFFKIPREFISISLPQIIISIGWFYVAAIVVFFIIESLSLIINKNNRNLYRWAVSFLPLFAFSIGNLIVYGPKKSLPYFILFIYFGAQKFIFPLISQKDKDSYVAKIEADEDAEWKNREDKEAFSVYLMRILGHKNIILVINLMLAVQLVHLSGELYASKRTKYLVPTNDMSKVVLNIYGDSIVYASFDKNTKKVKPVFSVSKLASDPNLVFNLEEIGPLTPSSQK